MPWCSFEGSKGPCAGATAFGIPESKAERRSAQTRDGKGVRGRERRREESTHGSFGTNGWPGPASFLRTSLTQRTEQSIKDTAHDASSQSVAVEDELVSLATEVDGKVDGEKNEVNKSVNQDGARRHVVDMMGR